MSDRHRSIVPNGSDGSPVPSFYRSPLKRGTINGNDTDGAANQSVPSSQFRSRTRIETDFSTAENGGAEHPVIDAVLDLLADAIWADLIERNRGDGHFPVGNKP